MRRALPLFALLALFVAGCTMPEEGNAPASVTGPLPSTGRLKLGMMPKNIGNPYFNACQRGAEEAAKALGDVDLLYDGPTQDRSELQAEKLDTWIVQKFGAIAVACNDADQIAPTLARARDAGIPTITWDADANPKSSGRLFFVNQVDAVEISKALVEEMVKQTGPHADVAVVSSSSTAPNQSAWLKQMEAYRKEKYPGLKVVVTEYAKEDQVLSEQKAQAILKAFPNVRGIWGMTSVAFPGAARAVELAGKKGQVAVVGLGTPKVMKPFVDSGVVKSVILWNPVDLGYLTVYTARAVARGELKEGATELEAGRMGKVTVRGEEVLLGKPMIFTAADIGEFDF